jgi:hypothetical protein
MTSLSQADSPRALVRNVSQQFAGRPTFEQAVHDMLEQAIKARYPSLTLDLSKTQLACPGTDTPTWRFQPFMPLVLDYLAHGTPVDLGSNGNAQCYLSDTPPHRLQPATGGLDMAVIGKLLAELPWTVPIGLAGALARHWNMDIDNGAQTHAIARTNRWQWLSDTLKNGLHVQALRQPRLPEPAREALDQIVRWPDRAPRFSQNLSPVYAYSLKSMLTQGESRTELPSSEILLLHYTPSGLVILLCSPGSAVQAFDSMEAFNRHWGATIAKRYVVDTVSCQRYEIDGNAFDTQAAMILEQQLADVEAIELPSQIGLQNLEALYSELSDPTRYLGDVPRLDAGATTKLTPLLPEWLKRASLADRTTFQRYSLALASVKQRSQDLHPIDDIRTFTADALLAQMQKTNDSSPDKVPPRQLHPDDVQLTFTVSAGYPGTVGISEKRTVSLTQLAIDNLVSRPSGYVTLSHRQGLALPSWLTADFISRRGGLVEQVDIGTTYPRYLHEALLSDLPYAQNNRRMFAEQIAAQLRLEALQNMLDNKNGMTRQGLGLIEAVLQPDVDGQRNDGRAVVIRHLAFLRKPQARPDVATNMFIVETHDAANGPHVLYRPLYTPVLLEFPTRQALLQSVATSGDLQDSILTWMADSARPVYANGGFAEPHVVHFFQSDEFSVPEKPAPATLAIDGGDDELVQYLRNGKLMEYLYGCNAQALVTQADRQSVSNSESRWAVFLQGGSLLFNTLLFPLLRGPAMASVWLLNLMASAIQDFPALNSDDPATRESAAVDLLINLALLVSQVPSLREPSHPALSASVRNQAMRAPATRFIPEQWPEPAPPALLEGPVALLGADAPGAILDLSFSNARHRLTPEQHAQLRNMQVALPASLPEPIEHGSLKGLYVIDESWHALVDGRLYRVTLESDDSVVIIDPLAPSRRGPLLQTDNQGNWTLDLRLRLRGGMPPRRIAEQRRVNMERTRELNNEIQAITAQETERQKALDVAQSVMERLQGSSTYTEEQRAPRRKVFYDLLNEQTNNYLKLLDSAPERARLGIELPSEILRRLMENIINNARKAFVVADMDYIAINTTYPQFQEKASAVGAFLRDPEAYFNFINAVSDINDRKIHWLELNDKLLDNLLNLDATGAQAFERLTKDRPIDEASATGTKGLQLATLPMLAIKHRSTDLPDSLFRIVEPLGKHVRTHAELRMYDLSPSEQLQVLESLTEHYGGALDALQGMKTLYAEDIHQSYFDRMIEVVKNLYQEVSGKLAAQVKPEPAPSKQPPRRSKTTAGRAQKKVIKTRRSGVLIGDLKPAGTTLPIEVVELRSEVDNELIATYSRHEDVWDVIEVQRPAAVPTTRALNAIKRDARELLGELAERLRRAERYRQHCQHPQEIEEIMNNEASRYRTLNEELDRAFAASQTPRRPADETLITQLSDAISELANKGSALRTQLSLQLPPTDGNLRYLFEKKLIQVARLGGRKALKGTRKDFLQEYAINDRDGSPLWYAHFHYETAETPKAAYSVAHLKSKEQRREHYHSLLAKADSPYAVVNVHRGQIGPALARDKFLPLAP